MIGIEEDHNGEEQCPKRLKSNLSFWSPLNDSFGLPDKKSKCSWYQKVDKDTNPHNTMKW